MTNVRGATLDAETLLKARQAIRRGLVQLLSGVDPHPPSWPRPARRAATACAVLGVLLLGWAVVYMLSLHSSIVTLDGQYPPSQARAAFTPSLFLVAVSPLLLAVRWPLLAWRVSYLAMMIVPTLPLENWGQQSLDDQYADIFMRGDLLWVPWRNSLLDLVLSAVLVATFFAAGLRHTRPVVWWMWTVMVLSLWLHHFPGVQSPADLALCLTVTAFALHAIWARRQTGLALAVQAETTDLERARRAVLQERARIAREMHDVVAHHMSMIAVQAETAPFRIGDLPENVRSEFLGLSAAAREALKAMRKLLGLLRDDRPAETAPQPRLADLPDLVEAARRAGARVELTMAADEAAVPPGVGVCVYRIVQEALSNAGRHAAGSAVNVMVMVAEGDEVLRLLVANGPGTTAGSPNVAGEQASDASDPADSEELDGDGPDPGPTWTDAAADASRTLDPDRGHGLAGMRERVALLGGSLTAAPDGSGGFAVWATLPLSDPDPVAG